MRRDPGETGRRTPISCQATTAMGVGLLLACAPTRAPAPPTPMPLPAPVVPAPAPVAAPRPAEGTVAGGAGDLWYRVVGDGPDTALVPLGSWLADSLSPVGAGHALIFYDPRHRGRSHAMRDSTDATFAGDVADVEAVREAFGLSRVALIGYDYYAGVVAAWAAAHPGQVTRLVLLGPIEPADSLARDWNPPARTARLDTVAARLLVKWRDAGRDTTDPVAYCEAFWRVSAPLFMHDSAGAGRLQPSWCAYPNEAPPRLAAAARGAMESLGPAADVGAHAAGITVPVMVIHGRNDLIANPEGAVAWASRFPGARLLWLRDTGHLPHIESGVAVRSAIEFFLSGHWPPLAGPP